MGVLCTTPSHQNPPDNKASYSQPEGLMIGFIALDNQDKGSRMYTMLLITTIADLIVGAVDLPYWELTLGSLGVLLMWVNN